MISQLLLALVCVCVCVDTALSVSLRLSLSLSVSLSLPSAPPRVCSRVPSFLFSCVVVWIRCRREEDEEQRQGPVRHVRAHATHLWCVLLRRLPCCFSLFVLISPLTTCAVPVFAHLIWVTRCDIKPQVCVPAVFFPPPLPSSAHPSLLPPVPGAKDHVFVVAARWPPQVQEAWGREEVCVCLHVFRVSPFTSSLCAFALSAQRRVDRLGV